MSKKKILIANDHAGFELKKKILNFNFDEKFIFLNLGCDTNDPVDYPDLAHLLSSKINRQEYKNGILICGSGIGMSMVSNRYKNVRAALCLNENMAKLAIKHNNANILVLGSRLISSELAIKCLITFFSNRFEGGRHKNRIEMINTLKK